MHTFEGKTKRREIPPTYGGYVATEWATEDGWSQRSYADYTNLLTLPCSEETITYETPNFKRFANCRQYSDKVDVRHVNQPYDYTIYKWNSRISAYEPSYRCIGWGPGDVEYARVGNRGPIYPGDDLPEHQSTKIGDLDPISLCEEGCKAITPGIESDISLINFLLELKDIKSFFTGPVDIARRLISDIQNNKRLKGLLRASGSIVLQDAYVNRTLLADITDIYSTLLTVASRVNACWENQEKSVSGHWSKKLTESVSTKKPNESFLDEGISKWYKENWETTEEKLFTLTLRYRYSLLDAFGNRFVDKSAFNAAFGLTRFGVELNPRIIWDAIPFSFVIDWFTNIGSVLDSFKVENIKYNVVLEDACYSLKHWRRSTYITRRTVNTLRGGPRESWVDAAYSHYERQTKTYTRVRFLPRREWLGAGTAFTMNGPSVVQWVRGAALIFSR